LAEVYENLPECPFGTRGLKELLMGESEHNSLCILHHAVPGRMRFKSVQGIPESSVPGIHHRIAQMSGVSKVRVRITTGSIIVWYFPRNTREQDLVEHIKVIVQAVLNGEPGEEGMGSVQNRGQPVQRDEQRGTRRLIIHGLTAAGLTLLLIYSFWRRVVRRRPLSENVFGLTGILTIAGSLPLFVRAWREWRAGRRMGLFPFLGISTLIAMGSGSVSTALDIIWTLSLGMFLEELAMEKARRDVRAMVDTGPRTGRVLSEQRPIETPVIQMQVGDIVVVHQEWIIPVDGVVVHGQALVNESKITGHEYPGLRKSGDWVYSGTTVLEGSLHVEAARPGRETYLNKVLDLVEQALESRSEVERKADVLAVRMVKMGTAATLGTMLVTRNMNTIISVLLVMSCPCATILAASTALSASLAAAARHNMLIKSGTALETMQAVDCVCFDKTGTLTRKQPELIDVQTHKNNLSRDDIYRIL